MAPFKEWDILYIILIVFLPVFLNRNSLSFGGVTLTTKNEVHSLGVQLDPALTVETQVSSVVRPTYFHLWWIAELPPYLDVGALTILVHAFVVFRLNYCNALYVGLPLRLMQKLQIVQVWWSHSLG